MTRKEDEPRLPPGYRLDRSDPDVWALLRPEGWVGLQATEVNITVTDVVFPQERPELES